MNPYYASLLNVELFLLHTNISKLHELSAIANIGKKAEYICGDKNILEELYRRNKHKYYGTFFDHLSFLKPTPLNENYKLWVGIHGTSKRISYVFDTQHNNLYLQKTRFNGVAEPQYLSFSFTYFFGLERSFGKYFKIDSLNYDIAKCFVNPDTTLSDKDLNPISIINHLSAEQHHPVGQNSILIDVTNEQTIRVFKGTHNEINQTTVRLAQGKNIKQQESLSAQGRHNSKCKKY